MNTVHKIRTVINRLLFNRLSLVVLALAFSFILLEIMLRSGGYLYTILKDSSIKSGQGGEEYTILCLGESTTDRQWPPILESMFEITDIARKVTVIDKGVSATNTGVILSHLPKYIDKYKPDMVICMMGINDRETDTSLPATPLYEENKTLKFFKNLRLIKLYKLIKLSIELKSGAYLKEKDEIFPLIPKPEDIDSYEESLYWGRQFRYKHDLATSEDLLQKAIYFEPDAAEPYIELGNLYRDFEKEDKALDNYNKAEYIEPENPLLNISKARFYSHFKEYEKAEDYYRKAINSDELSVQAYKELAEMLHEIGKCQKELDTLNAANKKFPENSNILAALSLWYMVGHDKTQDDKKSLEYLMELKGTGYKGEELYYLLGVCYMRLGRISDAEEAFLESLKLNPDNDIPAHKVLRCRQMLKAESEGMPYESRTRLHLREYMSVTKHNYRELCSYVISRGIKIVAVQYPMIDINILKDMLSDISSEIFFVDNGPSFRKLVAKKGYRKVFTDNFAEDFGHCTRIGNEVLAANIYNRIIGIIRDDIRHKQ